MMDELDYVRLIGRDLAEPNQQARVRAKVALTAAIEDERLVSGGRRSNKRGWSRSRRRRVLLLAAGALVVPTAGFAIVQSGERPVEAASCPEANEALRDVGIKPPTEYAECPDSAELEKLKVTLEQLLDKRESFEPRAP